MELRLSKDHITPTSFYGNKNYKSNLRVTENRGYIDIPVPFELNRLLGPSSVWKVFKKQIEALTFVQTKKCCLMAFVFQQNNGERLFLVAHPRWLWHYDSQKSNESRCSYEIIPEYTVCKLYFDLEFEISYNPNSDGAIMTDTFIKIVCFYIKTFWNIVVDRTVIIDLDSSTNSKFSRHLIFNSPKLLYRDNYNVGGFVKYVCNEVRLCIDQLNKGDWKHQLLNTLCLKEPYIKMLLVTNSKNKSVLFCDEGVYTKNRHFRMFKSTKPKRNSPLVLSVQNEYSPSSKLLKNVEEQVFLDSLITYLQNISDNQKVLEFEGSERTFVNGKTNRISNVENCKSPFPKIDQFIEKIVYPGQISRNNYFQTSNIIVYDIKGNRYCGNISRQHRSNNVKQVVDIENRCYYQKCYDPDCSTYRSESYNLPPEVEFFLDDEFDSYVSENDISFQSSFTDEDNPELFEIADVIEQMCS